MREAIGIAGASRAAVSEIKDYSAIFTKTERIKGRLRKQVMEMKLRAQPFSVHLRYQSKKEAGRQVLYVAGRNDGNLLVHGYKGRGALRLNPRNPFVPAENILVATDCGMKYLPREVANGKMRAMVEGAAIVRKELA